MKKYILAIESSCDETSVAIIDIDYNITKEITKTQIDQHKKYGGVVPEIASRSHLFEIKNILKHIFLEINKNQIVAVAATSGPGLIGGIIVGMTVAKGISIWLNVPFIAVNHLLGHALSPKIENKKFDYPFLLLLISGGHCQILFGKTKNDYKIIGKTIDDSVGEAFDKVAKMLGFEYPGGVYIEKAARLGDKNKYKFNIPMLKSQNPDFSFSGLKTSVFRTIEKIKNITDSDKYDICASFQETVIKTLSNKIEKAILICKNSNNDKMKNIKSLAVCGGVAANLEIKKMLEKMAKKYNLELFVPSVQYCTDNSSMIAIAALEDYLNKKFSTLDTEAKTKWSLEEL